MKRYPHYWWPLKSHRYPARIAVLDCDYRAVETTQGRQESQSQLVGWCLIVSDYRRGILLGQSEHSGDSVATAWDAIGQLLCSRWKVWLFVTPALEILDILGFRDKLYKREIELAGTDWRNPTEGTRGGEDKRDALYIDQGPPTLILCEFAGRPGRLLILDIRNIGISEITGDSDARSRSDRYSRGLCSAVQTLRTGRQGALRATAGAQAMSALRTAYPVCSMHCHTHHESLLLERAALYGGRCECFRIGEIEGPVYHLDVRNMYPALCRTLAIPVSLRSYHDTERAAESCGANSPQNCIAHVRIRSERNSYPCRREGIVCYPVGEYETVIAGSELQSAVESNSICRWYSCAEYTTERKLAPFMTHWLSELEKARRSNDVMLQQWIKRLMVSLIGKFAETGKRWVPHPYLPGQGPFCRFYGIAKNGELIRYRNVADYTMREEVNGESYWSMPAVAAFVTAAGRVQLFTYLLRELPGRVWYCDTDAILCDRLRYLALRDSGEIRDSEAGYLRLLGEHKRCHVYGIRHYSLDGTIKCAGPPRGEIQEGQSRADYYGATAAKSIRSNSGAGTGGGGIDSVGIPEVYRHGVVCADGTVTPWRIYDR